jgi:protein-S-isoprenylcysteine O-methyltransferase Ste14
LDAKAKRLAQAIFFTLSIGLILLVGGLEFLQRPVGLAFLILWTVLGVATAALRQLGTPSRYDRRQVAPRAVLGIFGFLALLVVGPWEYTHLSGPLPRDGVLAWVGIVLLAVGIGLNTWAMSALRELYTVRLSVQEGHRLVTDGPYRIVRHPGYSGSLLIFPGMGLALGSLAILAFVPPMVAWIVVRIRDEEAMLVTEFGEAYRSYQRRTKRLIPLLY